MQHLYKISILLIISLLLSGCHTRYRIEGHRAYDKKVDTVSAEFPTLTLEVGERVHAVTPATTFVPGGYWLAIYVEDSAIAKHLPHENSYIKGTEIEAVSVGRTKAYYGNAVYLEQDDAMDYLRDGHWFWIEVVERKRSRVED